MSDTKHYKGLLKEVLGHYRHHQGEYCSTCADLIARIEQALGVELPARLPGAKRCEVHGWEFYGETCEFCSIECKSCKFLHDRRYGKWDCQHPRAPKRRGAVSPWDPAPQWCPLRAGPPR